MPKLIGIFLLALAMDSALASEMSAQDVIRQAMNHYRGSTSYGEMTMVIHRPDWERSETAIAGLGSRLGRDLQAQTS